MASDVSLKASITSPRNHILQFAFPLMLPFSSTIIWATLVFLSSRRRSLIFPLCRHLCVSPVNLGNIPVSRQCLNNRTKSPFELVHIDVWGPCRTASTLGFQYFVTFIDDYSRCTWLFLKKNRAELYSIFQKFYAEILTQFNISIHV